jgi:hypothetical protein
MNQNPVGDAAGFVIAIEVIAVVASTNRFRLCSSKILSDAIIDSRKPRQSVG